MASSPKRQKILDNDLNNNSKETGSLSKTSQNLKIDPQEMDSEQIPSSKLACSTHISSTQIIAREVDLQKVDLQETNSDLSTNSKLKKELKQKNNLKQNDLFSKKKSLDDQSKKNHDQSTDSVELDLLNDSDKPNSSNGPDKSLNKYENYLLSLEIIKKVKDNSPTKSSLSTDKKLTKSTNKKISKEPIKLKNSLATKLKNIQQAQPFIKLPNREADILPIRSVNDKSVKLINNNKSIDTIITKLTNQLNKKNENLLTKSSENEPIKSLKKLTGNITGNKSIDCTSVTNKSTKLSDGQQIRAVNKPKESDKNAVILEPEVSVPKLDLRNEFKLKKIKLIKQKNKEIVEKVVSELNRFLDMSDERLIILDGYIEKLAKIALVKEDAVNNIKVNKLIGEKLILAKAKIHISNNLKIIKEIDLQNLDTNIVCPNLNEDTEDSLFSNDLTKMVFRRQILKRKIYDAKDALLALKSLSQEQDPALLKFSNLEFNFKDMEKELEELNLEIFCQLKKITDD